VLFIGTQFSILYTSMKQNLVQRRKGGKEGRREGEGGKGGEEKEKGKRGHRKGVEGHGDPAGGCLQFGRFLASLRLASCISSS